MKKLTKLLCLTLGLLLAAVITSQANSQHVDAWNNNCSVYSFQSYPQSLHSTFRDMYFGSDIDSDFDALIEIVEAAGGPISPPPTPDTDADVLSQ